ncbi:hypothetical protein OSTOST_09098, partial [Ostertagia ostertagi]
DFGLSCLHRDEIGCGTSYRFLLRPPNSKKDEDEELLNVMRELAAMQNSTILLGDFNLLIDWKNARALSSTSASFLNFFNEGSFHQHVQQPTHGSNILDIILSTFPDVINITIISVGHPDLKIDFSALNSHLLNQGFCHKLYEALSTFVPMRFPKAFCFRYPPQIKNLINQKERLFHELENPLNNSLYEKVCSDLDYILKRFLANHERRLASQSSLRRLHLYVRSNLKPKSSLPTLTDLQGSLLLNENAKAESLAQYIASVFSKVSSQSETSMIKAHISRNCPDIYFHPHEVCTIMKKLKPSLSEPIDGIPQI